MHASLATLVLVSLVGCGAAERSRPRWPAPGVTGARSDMTTAAGEYDGYRVLTECRDGMVGVVGDGGVRFAWLATPDDKQAQERFRARAKAAIAGIGSVHATGFGGGCGEEMAFRVFLSDWREIDQAIRRLGEWMRREQLSGEISLSVEPIPVIKG